MISNDWVQFGLRRVLGWVLAIAGLIFAVFSMVHLIPGDPVRASLGLDVTQEEIERVRQENGLDLPFFEQFWRYVENLAEGDLGVAWNTHEPVGGLIMQSIWPSVELAACALAVVFISSVVIGMAMGALTQNGRHPRIELFYTSMASGVGAMPDYLVGVVLVFLFAVQLSWFPVAGVGGVEALVLPVLAISLHSVMVLSRIVRLETLNVLAQDYVRTARSQRLPARTIYFRHVLPNALTASLTLGGIIFANVIGGAVVVEVVFNRPGLGTQLVAAIHTRQFAVIQGITLVLGVMIVLFNALIDVVLGILDPRSLSKRA